MKYKRIKISESVYFQFRTESFHEMHDLLKDGGFTSGQYINGWVCYVPLSTAKKRFVTSKVRVK